MGVELSELRGRRDGDDNAADTGRTADSSGDELTDRDRPEERTPAEKLNQHLDDLYWPGYSSQPAPPDTSDAKPRPADEPAPKQEDPFASYPPALQPHLHHDDTLARLQYLSPPPPEPPNDHPATSNPQPHATDVPEPPAPSPATTPTDEPGEPTDQPGDESADQVGGEPADQPRNEPRDESGDQAGGDEAGDEPGDVPVAEPVDRPADQPADQSSVELSGGGASDQPGDEAAQADDPAATSEADPAVEPLPAPNEDVADPDKSPVDTDSSEPAESRYADLVAERDKTWDPAEAALPPGALPESTKPLAQEVIDALHPDVRRILEYEGAAEYITANKDQRPWLEPASDASPQVQRLFTAIDQGTGHAHIRHGPMGNDELYANRVAHLEDPAQTDPTKRAQSIDGLDEAKQHYCGRMAVRIHDPEAFAAAFAGVVKHPEVRRALDVPWAPTGSPDRVSIPIADLLGPAGHESCSGYRLRGEWSEVKKARKQWVDARAAGADMTAVPAPETERITTFEGGNILVSFSSNLAERRYEIATLFPEPADS